MERSDTGEARWNVATRPRPAARWRWASPRTAAIVGAVALVAPLATIPTHDPGRSATSSGPGRRRVLPRVRRGVRRPSASSSRDASRATRSGWLLLGASLAMSAGNAGPEYAYLDYTIHHGRLPLGAVGGPPEPGMGVRVHAAPADHPALPRRPAGAALAMAVARLPLRGRRLRRRHAAGRRRRPQPAPSAGQRRQPRRLEPSARQRGLGRPGCRPPSTRVLRRVLRRGRRRAACSASGGRPGSAASS